MGHPTPWPVRSGCLDPVRGFTMVEMMVTAILVAILISGAIPLFARSTARAKAVGAKQGVRTLLTKAYLAVKSGEFAPEQLMTLGLDGMAEGSTMAEARDGKFLYQGEMSEPTRYVVVAQSVTDASLAGETLVGCIDLELGIVQMQPDFFAPAPDCGQTISPPGNSAFGQATSQAAQGN